MSFLSTTAGVAVIDTRTRPGTIVLPLTSQIPNRYLQFKDLYGAFSRSSLTISTQAGESFDDGTTSKIYTDPFTFLTLYAGSTTKWSLLGGTQTISQTVSSLNVSSITIGSGYGWIVLPPVQAPAVSTGALTADSFVGNTITANSTTSMYISAQILYVSSIMGAAVSGGGGTGDVTKANLASTTLGLQSAATQFVSSLTVNTITVGTGSGWLQLPFIQTTYASTIFTQAQALYSLSSYFGQTSTATALQFNGLLGNYNNTVLAEISTGAGTQEFLVFKGSSTSDRVRVQTTGTFVVETGVSARLWDGSTVPTGSNATPAFIVNTSSNVGIQTATPGTTLDVAGTGRFQIASTLTLNLSTLNGGNPLVNAFTTNSIVALTGNSNAFTYDGNQWIRGSGIGNEVHGLAFNGSLWVSGTEAGIFSSANGINWAATSFTSSATSATAWNGTLWVVGGWYGGMWFSYDGYTWTACPQAPTQTVQDVAWGKDKFVAACAGAVYYSYDGLYWFNVGNVLAGGDQTYAVAYNGRMWLIGGRYASVNNIAYSFDGINWIGTGGNGYNISDFAWNGRIWVATTATSQTVLTSPDGITWTARTNTNFLDLGGGSVTWNGSFFYVASGNTLVYLSRSTDGITWTSLGTIAGQGLRKIRSAFVLPLNGAQDEAGIYAQNIFLGISTNQTILRFPGGDGLYRNTAIGEISSFTRRFAHDLVLFKGSTPQDSIRLQTTGEVRFETGVSSRFFSSISSIAPIATPTFLISTNSNVGIGTALPATTLDVAGTARAITLSSQQLNVSSVNGGALLATSNLVSTTSQLQTNIENWSQYITTSDVTLSNTTSITVQNPNNALQLKAPFVSIVDAQGGYGGITLGSASFTTSSTTETYTLGFSDFVTGTVSSFFVGRNDGVTLDSAPLYISTLYFGNIGGTTVGQLTTDGTATDLFWNGSKLNNQSGGGGGGGAIDYVSAFTVSTGYLEVSSISSYVIYTYGIIGTQLFNVGPDPLTITSLTNTQVNAYNDLNFTVSASTITNTNAFYLSSSNDVRLIAPSNIYMDTPQVLTSNLYVYEGVSTYSMTIYGPSTLTVQGWSFFQNTVSTPSLITNTLGVIDIVTGQPSYIQASNGGFDFNGGAVLNQIVLNSTIEGLGTFGYISSTGGTGGVSQIIAGSNVTIDPVGGTGAVTINASGGGSGPYPSPFQIGSNSTESYIGFYGTDGTYTQSVVGEESIGGGNQELVLFRGSNAMDRIRMQTTGTIVFESGVSSRVWPSAPSNAIPSMLIDVNSNIGIQTASPATTLDVAGTGRFVEVSTITLRTNTLYTNVFNVAIQSI